MAEDNRFNRLKRIGMGALIVGAMAAVGCSSQPDQAVVSQAAVEEGAVVSAPSPEYSAEGPIVETLDDGTIVQRTPSDDLSSYNAIAYNTSMLKADARGCSACHEDLAETLKMIPDYDHLLFDVGVTEDLSVEQCTLCHSAEVGAVASDLAPLIHGIHLKGDGSDQTACFTCHDTQSDQTASMPLWDAVKHERMRGITKVEDVQGDFSFTQDSVIPTEELYNINWLYQKLDIDRWERVKEGQGLDEEMFETWTVTVSGEVENEVTYTLPELIETAPSVTTAMKMHCDVNPLGGPLIGQVEVTGIPVSWLMEQAGLKDTAVSCKFVSPDGHGDNDYAGLDFADMESNQALLVYEINGERLSWEHGYPVQAWLGGTNASRYGKQISDLIVSDTSFSNISGFGSSRGLNVPNVGVMNTREGQVIQAGAPYTFEGYADAWQDPIAALEFSMDGGATWTRFATPDANTDQWIDWSFTWTPEANVDTAYVLSFRGITESGVVTASPVEVMVNAKTGILRSEVE